jgi:hypothetical protein
VLEKLLPPSFDDELKWFNATPALVERRQLALLAYIDNMHFLISRHLLDAYVLLLCDRSSNAWTLSADNNGADDDSSATESDDQLSSTRAKHKRGKFLHEAQQWIQSVSAARTAFECQVTISFFCC